MPTLVERSRARAKLFVALAVVALGLVSLPRTASALKTTLCSTVTCTGGAPSLKYSAGGGLSHPEIVPIFWGSYWTTGTSPSQGQMIGAIQVIVNGPYLGALSQYGGDSGVTVGPARMVPAAPIYTGTPVSATCLDGTACTVGGAKCADRSRCVVREPGPSTTIDTLIGAGVIPGPAPHADMLYVVFVPPTDSADDWNGHATCSATCGSAFSGQSYKVAMVKGGDGGGLAHEIVEAIADNISNANCTDVTSGAHANQIVDLCGCYHETEMVGSSNPFEVPAYWSDEEYAKSGNGCVIPEGWDGVWMYDFYSWTQIYGSEVRQVYAGNNGLVATDTDDNLVGIRGTMTGALGGPGAMFAVGDSSIMGLAADASQVWLYDGKSWTLVGGGASSILSGGFEVATDFGGAPWVYDGATWTKVGGMADQFAVNHAGIVALGSDHQSVWLDASGTASGWTTIGGSASELFVGRDNGIALATLAATKDVSYYGGSGTTWYAQGGPGNCFAITMDGFFFGLSPARDAVFLSTSTGTNNPLWIQTGTTPLGRLVARSDSGGGLYATGTVVF